MSSKLDNRAVETVHLMGKRNKSRLYPRESKVPIVFAGIDPGTDGPKGPL